MSHAPNVVSFLTDVEGNLDHFARAVANSRALYWAPPYSRTNPPDFDSPESNNAKLMLHDGYDLVFGGDVQDKGLGDIRIPKLLLDLDDRFPDRVHLIVGNRDANKLRFGSELSMEAMLDAHTYIDPSFPYWVPFTKRMSPEQYATKHGIGTGPEANNVVTRTKWILDETMGAQGAFERRRFELAIIEGKQLASVTDTAVVASFHDQVNPNTQDPFMLRYMERAKVMHVFGATLFLHGAISNLNLGKLPSKTANASFHPREWPELLNQWKQEQVDAYKNNPSHGKTTTDRAAYELLHYVLPATISPDSVITSSNLAHGHPSLPHPTVGNFLRAANLATIVSGHMPHGDIPLTITDPVGQINLISADTSYSNNGARTQKTLPHDPTATITFDDNRGAETVNELLIYDDGSVRIHGRNARGKAFDMLVPTQGVFPRPLEGAVYPLVGQPCNPRWVKSFVDEADMYIITDSNGWAIQNEAVKTPRPCCGMPN